VESHRPHHDRMYDLKPTERDDRPQAAVNAARIDKAVAPELPPRSSAEGRWGCHSAHVWPPPSRGKARDRMAAPVRAPAPSGSYAHEPVQVVAGMRAPVRPAGMERTHHQLALAGESSHVSPTSVSASDIAPGDATNRPTHTCRVCRIAQLIVRCLQNVVPIACLSEHTLRTSPQSYNRTRPHAGTTGCNGL
jgi:hypothetical protein